MNYKSILIFILILFLGQVSTAQTKNEKEDRITLQELPNLVQTTIKALPKNCKRIRFYKETDNEKISYEVKFKFKKTYYSIEFNALGHIEDIEVTTKFKNVNTAISSKITTYLAINFIQHRFIKIQKQYVYVATKTPINFMTEVLSKKIDETAQYEIIAEVKTNINRTKREFTFSSDGKFLNFRILNPSSYEYVLY